MNVYTYFDLNYIFNHLHSNHIWVCWFKIHCVVCKEAITKKCPCSVTFRPNCIHFSISNSYKQWLLLVLSIFPWMFLALLYFYFIFCLFYVVCVSQAFQVFMWATDAKHLIVVSCFSILFVDFWLYYLFAGFCHLWFALFFSFFFFFCTCDTFKTCLWCRALGSCYTFNTAKNIIVCHLSVSLWDNVFTLWSERQKFAFKQRLKWHQRTQYLISLEKCHLNLYFDAIFAISSSLIFHKRFWCSAND